MSVSIVLAKLFESFGINCTIFFVTLLGALPVGLLIAFGAMSRFRPLACLIKTFVWVIRGTPLMLQIIFIYYGPGLLHWGQPWASLGVTGRVIASCVAFIINYACYFSEIFRGGIQSIPRGQYEAGQVLGMTKSQIFFRITFMTLIKDTALANIIASKEIIMMSKEFVNNSLLWPLFSTAVFFLVFCGILTLLFGWLEKKMDYFRV